MAYRFLFLALALFTARPEARAETIRATLLHLNDVYEITPVQGGKQGGLARVATIRKALKGVNPNTYTFLGGDCFSPSALGTAVVGGKPLAGRQMVAVMNAVGLDFATFGNHEFDLNEEQFHERLRESRFCWFSGNVRNATGGPFPATSEQLVLRVPGKQGGTFRIGVIGLTLDSNRKPYVSYLDPIRTAREQVRQLAGRVDAIVALTHLSLEEDTALAVAVPEIDAILGGHEHENVQVWRGIDFTPILKADANARSVYVLDLTFDTVTRRLKMGSRLKTITESIPEDPAVKRVAYQWVKRGFDAFRRSGFKPEEVVARVPEPLDGTEASVRNRPTNLGEIVAQAMIRAFPHAELAFYNGGSIRIDDVIPPGPLTQYDVIRILPFGGNINLVEITGSTLIRALRQGYENRGQGGYFQVANLSRDQNGAWLAKGEPIDPERRYRVVINDFLLTGRERGLDFLKPDGVNVGPVTPGPDIRFALIDELKARWSAGNTKVNH
jgi:5'-nucleotidase / UDP-sugar diphosphatase